MIDKVRVLKLVDGQEVIGRDYEQTPTGVRLSHVMTVRVVPQGDRLAVTPMPFSFVSDVDQKIVFDGAHIIAVLKPSEDFARSYLSQTSGLVLPSSEPQAGPSLSLVD